MSNLKYDIINIDKFLTDSSKFHGPYVKHILIHDNRIKDLSTLEKSISGNSEIIRESDLTFFSEDNGEKNISRYLFRLLARLFLRHSLELPLPAVLLSGNSMKKIRAAGFSESWHLELSTRAAKTGLKIYQVCVPPGDKIKTSILKVLYSFIKLFKNSNYRPVDSGRLIILTKYPEPGKVKQRLTGSLGKIRASVLQRKMLDRILSGLEPLRDLTEIHFTGCSRKFMRRWTGERYFYRKQSRGNIGRRMFKALSNSYKSGAAKSVLIGSDLPGITMDDINQAFEKLDEFDIVLGPSGDGGYYLIGTGKPRREIFRTINWSSKSVLSETLSNIRKIGLSCTLLDEKTDIDTPDDLVHLPSELLRTTNPKRPKISVIIPALNEERNIVACIKSIGSHDDVEIIVADGGSADKTCSHAAGAGARVIKTSALRSLQLNAGASRASGDIFLFLHADTRLPENWYNEVISTSENPEVSLGCFKFKMDIQTLPARFIEIMANLRVSLFRMPFGDQALFTRSSIFKEEGGFPFIEIMEDFEFVRKLRRRGRVYISSLPALTSGRRWKKMGFIKPTLINKGVIRRYYLGWKIPSLRKIYKRKQGIEV